MSEVFSSGAENKEFASVFMESKYGHESRAVEAIFRVGSGFDTYDSAVSFIEDELNRDSRYWKFVKALGQWYAVHIEGFEKQIILGKTRGWVKIGGVLAHTFEYDISNYSPEEIFALAPYCFKKNNGGSRPWNMGIVKELEWLNNAPLEVQPLQKRWEHCTLAQNVKIALAAALFSRNIPIDELLFWNPFFSPSFRAQDIETLKKNHIAAFNPFHMEVTMDDPNLPPAKIRRAVQGRYW